MKTKNKKLVKSALLGVAVLGLAVGVSAFTNKLAEDTWYYHGSNDPLEIVDPNNYTKTPPKGGCGELETLCQVSAPSNSSGQIDMNAPVTGTSQNVAQQLLDAQENLDDNETVISFRAE